MVTMEQTLNWLTLCGYGSICTVKGGHYVSKLTLLMQYFLQFFANGFQTLIYGDHGQDLECLNFSWLWLNFQGDKVSLCFNINFVYTIFLGFFLLIAFKLKHLVSINKTFNWLTCLDLASIFKVTGGFNVSKLFI